MSAWFEMRKETGSSSWLVIKDLVYDDQYSFQLEIFVEVCQENIFPPYCLKIILKITKYKFDYKSPIDVADACHSHKVMGNTSINLMC